MLCKIPTLTLYKYIYTGTFIYIIYVNDNLFLYAARDR